MKNYLCKGEEVVVTASGAIVSGEAQQVGDLVGVASDSVSTGEEYALKLEGVFTIKKKTTDVIAHLVKLYWDNTAKEVTVTVGTNKVIGYAYNAAGNGETSVQVKLGR